VLSRRLFDGLEKTPLADIPNTIYEHYQRRFNISVVNAVERIRAVAAEPEEAHHLEVATGTPLLEIERVAHTHRQQPIELRISRCLTDRYHYLNLLE
jgi:GntR family transcriptional regulator